MRKTNQSGFAALEAILIFIVIAIIGFTGWFVWHSRQNTDTALNAANKSRLATVQPTNTKSSVSSTKGTNTKAVDTQAYLTIKEWAVKLPLSSTITDAYYAYKNGYAYLSTVALQKTQCAADKTTLGVIARYTLNQKDPNTEKTYYSELSDSSTKVGQYYYYYTHPQADCSDGDKIVQEEAGKDMELFKAAIDKIQAE